MTSLSNLGRLQPVSLRDVWTDEARDFTPWLAEAENLGLLGEALGLALELEAREISVGPFSADILARDLRRDVWVVIENQLEPTDHRHLGQLLTYAAGLSASTVVWVAPDFRDEHRAAIDWLNQATADGFDFFGVQVELFRIADSPPAPRFNVVAKPNDWRRQATAGRQQIAQAAPTESHRRWMAYWGGLLEKAQVAFPAIAGRAIAKGNWQPLIRLRGTPDATFDLVATAPRGGLRIELYIDLRLAKPAFLRLESQKTTIENAFGTPLAWELLPDARASRVATYMMDETGADTARPDRQYEWMLSALPRFINALKPAVLALNMDSLASAETVAAG